MTRSRSLWFRSLCFTAKVKRKRKHAPHSGAVQSFSALGGLWPAFLWALCSFFLCRFAFHSGPRFVDYFLYVVTGKPLHAELNFYYVRSPLSCHICGSSCPLSVSTRNRADAESAAACIFGIISSAVSLPAVILLAILTKGSYGKVLVYGTSVSKRTTDLHRRV